MSSSSTRRTTTATTPRRFADRREYQQQSSHTHSNGTTTTTTSRPKEVSSSSSQTQQQQQQHHKRLNSSLLSSFLTTSISKHYAVNNHILSVFDSCYEKKQYHVAYAVGLQFVETALLEIPKHGYYYSQRHEEERIKSSKEALRVCQLLEQILQQELINIGGDGEDGNGSSPDGSSSTTTTSQLLNDCEDYKVARLVHLAQEQQESNNLERFEKERESVEHDLREQEMLRNNTTTTTSWRGPLNTFCAKLFDYADVVNDAICTTEDEKQKQGTMSKQQRQHFQQQSRDGGGNKYDYPYSSSTTTSRMTTTTNGPSRRVSGIIDTEDDDKPELLLPKFRRSQTEPIVGSDGSSDLDYLLISEANKQHTDDSALSTQQQLRRQEQKQLETADWYRLDDSAVVNEPTPTISDQEWTSLSKVSSSSALPYSQQQQQQRELSDVYELSRDASEQYRGAYVVGDNDNYNDDALRQSASSSFVDRDLERALWLSGLSRPEPSSFKNKKKKKKQSDAEIDILSLQFCYHEDFDLLRETRRVRISRLSTHQGRLPGSINGCTVIAPLLCIHHFLNTNDDHKRNRMMRNHHCNNNNNNNNPYLTTTTTTTLTTTTDSIIPTIIPSSDLGLTDDTMEQVIDRETAAILPEVRTNLGLTKDAMIIPSDVHDYLIEKKLLSQEQFVEVMGGNILDNEHVDSFLSCLRVANASGAPLEGKKIAATLFFHEHVITILKLKQEISTSITTRERNHEDLFWYDWIDSLPSQSFLRRSVEFVEDEEQNHHHHDPFLIHEEESSRKKAAARIRCVNEEALKSTLLWYACSKFTDDNRAYIDAYAWDENDTDFDPRVFQAFVWSEL